MNLDAAANLAGELLAEHGLHGWRFAFNRRKRAMGLCRYPEQRIELSFHFVQANDEPLVRETLLHEIAHALAGADAGHGPRWRRIARKLGVRPTACGDAAMPPGRWQARCPGCGTNIDRHQRPKPGYTYHCSHCGPDSGALCFRHLGHKPRPHSA